MNPDELIFVGIGDSAVGWYRCYLPAIFLGADWAGAHGEPPNLSVVTGLVKRETRLPNLHDYKVVVLQQPAGPKWLDLIGRLQAGGVKVIYEVDDYLHAISRMPDHDFREHFDARYLAGAEACMKACDAMIVSTDYLARKYRRFNEHVYVCRIGIDPARYRLTRPSRPTVNIGWSGATGHKRPVERWLPAVARIMREHDDTCFVSLGQPWAEFFRREGWADRALAIPFCLVDQYPAAMTMMDVGIAPAGRNGFMRAKSDLRFLEAGALGIPLVADPLLYGEIEDGKTGLLAETGDEAYRKLKFLMENPEARVEMGEAAREYVLAERTIEKMAPRWLEVAEAVANA